MAIAAAISRNAGGDSTGTQDITVSGFGTPQAAIVWGTGAETDGVLRNGLDFSIGFTDGTRQRCCCIFSENGVPTSDTDKRQFTDEIVAQLDPGGSAVDAEANFSSFSSDKMTINWGVGTLGTPMLFQTLLLKGFDNVYAGTITLGNKDVAVPITDPGFTPDLVLFISVCRSEIDQTVASAALNIGVAHNGGSIVQRSYNFLTSNDAAKTIALARLQTDCISLQYADYEGGIYYYVELTSFDANGFTVYPRTNDGASDVIFYLALKYSSGEFYLDTMDSPTSTGNDAQTGPGFEPTLVMLLPTLLQAVNTPVYPNQNEDDVAWGLAAFTETEEFCHSVHEENDSPSIDNAVLSDDTAINLYEDDHSSQMFVAAFSSMDSNGWTLNFSTVDSTTRKWIAIAIGETAAQQRQFNSNISTATSTDPIDLAIQRQFSSTLTTTSQTSGIDLVNLIQFASTLAGASQASGIDIDLKLSFISAIAGASATDPIDLNVQRQLQSAPAAASSTDPVDLAIVRPLISTLAAASQTSGIDLVNLVGFLSTLAAATATDPVDVNVLRQLTSALAAATTTDPIDLIVQRPLDSTLAAATDVSNIDLDVAGALKQFNSTLVAVSVVAALDLDIQRQLQSAIAAVTDVSSIDLDIAGLKQFVSILAAVTDTVAVDLAVQRPLASTSAAASATSGIDLDRLLSFLSTLAAASATSGIDLTRTVAFATTIAGITATSGIDLSVGAIEFFTTIVATTSTAGIDLWPEILGEILDTMLESTSVIRTIDSLMIPDRDQLVINRPATV